MDQNFFLRGKITSVAKAVFGQYWKTELELSITEVYGVSGLKGLSAGQLEQLLETLNQYHETIIRQSKESEDQEPVRDYIVVKEGLFTRRLPRSTG